jgi:hypothetical protein
MSPCSVKFHEQVTKDQCDESTLDKIGSDKAKKFTTPQKIYVLNSWMCSFESWRHLQGKLWQDQTFDNGLLRPVS